jgi:rRNA maturation RNase YbeY
VNGLDFFFEEINPFPIRWDLLENHIEFLITNENKKPGEISIILCSDDYLLKINEQYLGHDYYTDIVTFDYVKKSVISGDLFISVDRVKENAGKFNRPFKEEIYRVIFHGVLHLVGYKDKTEAEGKQMKEKENFYLKRVDFKKEEI